MRTDAGSATSLSSTADTVRAATARVSTVISSSARSGARSDSNGDFECATASKCGSTAAWRGGVRSLSILDAGDHSGGALGGDWLSEADECCGTDVARVAAAPLSAPARTDGGGVRGPSPPSCDTDSAMAALSACHTGASPTARNAAR